MYLKHHFDNFRVSAQPLCTSVAPKICMEYWVEKQLRLPLIENCSSLSLVTFHFANMLTLLTIFCFSCKCFSIMVSSYGILSVFVIMIFFPVSCLYHTCHYGLCPFLCLYMVILHGQDEVPTSYNYSKFLH